MTHPVQPSPAPQFRSAPNLRWEELGEEHIVFNPLSDEIHRLNPMAAAALSELEQSPLDLATLTLRMGSLMNVEPNGELQQQLWDMLRQFDEIGLVTPFLPLSSG